MSSDNSSEYHGTSLAEDSEQIRGWWRHLSHTAKVAASITAIITLFAMPVAAVLWIVGTVNEAQAQTVEKVEHLIDTRIMHTEAVPREVYNEHVRQFIIATDKSEDRDREILRKLDLLGESVYRTRGDWRDRLKMEGMTAEPSELE